MLIENENFTTEELEDIYNSDNVDISLSITDVSNTVSSDIKTSLQETAKKNGLTIGNPYLDIRLYKNSEAIHTTSSKIKISIAVSEDMINSDSNSKRTYYVLRYHDEEISSNDGTFDSKAKTFTFETDKFSAYALAHKDIKTEEKTTKKSTDTSDKTNIALYGGLVLLSMIGITVLLQRSKSEQ